MDVKNFFSKKIGLLLFLLSYTSLIISFLTRGSRFFIIAFLIGNFGSAMKKIIEKKLVTVSIVISLILIVILVTWRVISYFYINRSNLNNNFSNRGQNARSVFNFKP